MSEAQKFYASDIEGHPDAPANRWTPDPHTEPRPDFDQRALTEDQRYLSEDIASSMPDGHEEKCAIWWEDGDGCNCHLVLSVANGLAASRVVAIEVERGWDSTIGRGDRVVRLPFRPMPAEASTGADAAARSSEGVKPLTADEVAALRPGQAIEVIWSGGNGPHHYIVREKAGTLYAGNPRNDNPLTGPGTFIGQERYHTRVWKLVRLAPSSEAVEARLDVKRLAEWFHNKWEAQGIACSHRNQHLNGRDCGRDALEVAEWLATASSREGDTRDE